MAEQIYMENKNCLKGKEAKEFIDEINKTKR